MEYEVHQIVGLNKKVQWQPFRDGWRANRYEFRDGKWRWTAWELLPTREEAISRILSWFGPDRGVASGLLYYRRPIIPMQGDDWVQACWLVGHGRIHETHPCMDYVHLGETEERLLRENGLFRETVARVMDPEDSSMRAERADEAGPMSAADRALYAAVGHDEYMSNHNEDDRYQEFVENRRNQISGGR